MGKLILTLLLFFCAFITKAQNLILNGSFEQNNATILCWDDIDDNMEYNNLIHYSTSFGDDYTTALFSLPCLVCSPQVNWGETAQNGNFVMALIGEDETIALPTGTIHSIKQGRISLVLSAPLSNEKWYKLSFYIKALPPTLYS